MTPNQGMVEAWNGAEAAHYVDHADRYDRQLAPFATALLEGAGLAPESRVLDVGCGSGATTIDAARRVATALGIDISAPLLQVASARARAAAVDNARFLVADAQTHDFGGDFDVVVSQFGLMFFDDPVAAFTNLRRALVPRGRLAFVTWQPLAANEWLMVLGRALERRVALPSLGGLAAGPGMFALQDPDDIAGLLGSAGYRDVGVEPLTPTILLGGGGPPDESVEFLLGTGIARGLLGGADEPTRAAVVADVHADLAARHDGTGIRVGAAGWLVTARAA